MTEALNFYGSQPLEAVNAPKAIGKTHPAGHSRIFSPHSNLDTGMSVGGLRLLAAVRVSRERLAGAERMLMDGPGREEER